MKASKKVMESVIVSGLALTLAVTAVTGNGVNIAAKDAADTQFVNNGIAGVASAMNEYELESADYLDRYISVERQMRLWLRQQQMERLYPEMIQKKKKPQKRKLLPKRNRSGRIS